MRQFLYCVTLLLMTAACSEPESTKVSTAAAEVRLVPETLMMPGLNRSRQVRLYLPPGYAQTDKSYPVLYMHDGQNVFDDATSYAGEWGVDETLNELASSGQLELIVVAIDNGGEQRITELNPVDHAKYGKAEGKAYVDFIASVLKPYIDQHYRTLPQVQHTGIMGSSLGGLISHYALLEYPHVFGKAGIFSPSYWITGEQVRAFESRAAAKDALMYFYMGGAEGDAMVPDVERVYQAVLANGHAKDLTHYHLVADAGHNEAAWRAEFKAAVLWLYRSH